MRERCVGRWAQCIPKTGAHKGRLYGTVQTDEIIGARIFYMRRWLRRHRIRRDI